MEPRYSLRFETGDRAGQTVPVVGAEFTIGRRPGNSLQILDNSVSGKHAEIVVDEKGALLRDLGSTNGTRIGEVRVIEARLSGGERIHFGNVRLAFLGASAAQGVDAPVAPAASSEPAGAAPAAAAGAGLHRVDESVLARSRKRPLLGLVGLVVLVAAAAGLWFFFGHPAESRSPRARPAEPAPDNLLGEDYSFESESEGWSAGERAPIAFLRDGRGAVSGAFGVVADLGAGEWALHRSREVSAQAGREVVASASLRVDGGATAQIGVELAPAGGEAAGGAAVAWSDPVEGTRGSPEGFRTVEVSTVVPAGLESMRMLVLGRAGAPGLVAADDAVLRVRDVADGDSGGSRATVQDWDLVVLGEGGRTGVLEHFGRVLLSSIAFADGTTPAETAAAGPLGARVESPRIVLGSPGRGTFCLRVEPALVREGLATLAADGYSAHGLEFEREGVTSLMLGKGGELVRLAFAAPVTLRAVAEDQACRIVGRATSDEIGDVTVQLDFAEERRQAGDLAYAARDAERKGDLGGCLARWAELLRDVPFDEALVAEAEAKRGELVQHGLSELQQVRAEIERARFFRLLELYRQCRRRALEIGTRFAGSEVEAESRKVVEEVDVHLAGLEADLAAAERARLESILAVLESRQATGLAAEVRERLRSLPVRTPDAPGTPAGSGAGSGGGTDPGAEE